MEQSKKEQRLKEFDGEWVLLFDDEIINHSQDVGEMLHLADELYPAESSPRDHVKIAKVISGSLHVQ